MHRPWTEAEVARAAELRARGHSLERIGAALGRDPWGALGGVLRLAAEGLTPAQVLDALGLGGRRASRASEARILSYQARAAAGLPLFDADARADEPPPCERRRRERGEAHRSHAG